MVVTEQSGGKEASTPRQEHAALQEQNRLLQAEIIALRQRAHYHRAQYQRAVQRAQELEAQVGVLKAKVARLQQRLFGRKSERAGRATPLGAAGESGIGPRARGQQPGGAGDRRKLRENLPVVETAVGSLRATKALSALRLGVGKLPSPSHQRTDRMGSAPLSAADHSAELSSSFGCHCQPQRPDIISAPLAPALIPKGILAPSFLSEVLVLKFLYHMPLERIRAMVRSAGLEFTADTLRGVLERLTPLFAPAL